MRIRTYAGATPVGPDAHVDVPLSNYATAAWDAQTDQFIAEAVAPLVSVGKQSDKFYVIEREDFHRTFDTLRAPRARANRITYRVSSDTYFCDNHALAGDNAIEDLNNADDPIELRENTTLAVVTGLQRGREVRVANLLTSISNVGSGVALTGQDRWSDAASDPIGDVTTAHAFIRANTGLVANRMVLDWDTFRIVRRHPLLLDLYKYTSGGELSMDQLRDAFDVEQIALARAIKENSAEGAATASVTNVWGNTSVLMHVGAVSGRRVTAPVARFEWRSNGIYPANLGVLRSVMNGAGEEHVEVIEAGHFADEKVVARNLAYTINDTI